MAEIRRPALMLSSSLRYCRPGRAGMQSLFNRGNFSIMAPAMHSSTSVVRTLLLVGCLSLAVPLPAQENGPFLNLTLGDFLRETVRVQPAVDEAYLQWLIRYRLARSGGGAFAPA